MKTKIIAGQPSWLFSSDKVETAVTCQGGHLGPVKFRLGDKVVKPFSIAPWAEKKKDPSIPPLLQVLRGDFFCAPFGGGTGSYRGEDHPPHGETANSKWGFKKDGLAGGHRTLHLALETKIRKGRVDKRIQLREGQTVLYCQHVISGMSGKMSLGHHAMLKFSGKESSCISTSKIRLGQVFPGNFENPIDRGYSFLKPGRTFSSLRKVPSVFSTVADLSIYPARRGFDDLVMLAHQAADDFAWVAVTFPAEGYVWFALKDPRVLQSSVFWISNGGRHYPPWNSEHVNVLGVEDVTSYFHRGLNESCRPNDWNRRGIATSVNLSRCRPLVVNYIMGVAKIPPHFRRVEKLLPGRDKITLISDLGLRIDSNVDPSFLKSPELI